MYHLPSFMKLKRGLHIIWSICVWLVSSLGSSMSWVYYGLINWGCRKNENRSRQSDDWGHDYWWKANMNGVLWGCWSLLLLSPLPSKLFFQKKYTNVHYVLTGSVSEDEKILQMKIVWVPCKTLSFREE